MIKLKLNPLDNKFKDISYVKNERISETIERISKDLKIEKEVADNVFSVHVNGMEIDRDFYPLVKPKEKSLVVISVNARGSSFGETFKMIAVIVVVAVVSSYTGGMGAPITAGLINAAAAVGTSLLLNALIPPPKPSMSGAVGMSGQPESQAYSITGQANSVSKYGVVPRVYGSHRIFPTVAANPYIQIEVNSSGKQEQYLYAIYDFGYGPLQLTEIKIGDTLLSNFSSVEYNFVDINKPDISSGPWDDVHVGEFSYYKGDVNIESLAFSLNTDNTSVIATSSPNTEDLRQEIEIFFTAPQGLIGYDTGGGTASRTVELRIELSDEGEDNWYAFSDPSRVYNGVTSNDRALVYMDVELSQFGLVGGRKEIYSSLYGGDSKFKSFAESDPTHPVVTIDELSYKNTAYQNRIFRSDKALNMGTEFYKGTSYLGKIVEDFSHHMPSGATGYAYRLGLEPDKVVEITLTSIVGSFRISEDDKVSTYVKDYYQSWLKTASPSNSGYVVGGRTGTDLYVMKANQTSPYYGQVTINPISKKPQDIRVTRIRAYGPSSFSTFDNISWGSIQTRFDTQPIKTNNRHTFLELKIKASEQLNGSIQTLSANATSILDVYDGFEWVKAPTSNPAWVFVDILTGSVNKRALSNDSLDLESIREWAQYCDEVPEAFDEEKPYVYPRFQTNLVIDYSITVREILDQICGASNSTINLYNGKYGVLVDKEKTIPAQLITNRNSRDFSLQRNYAEEPHAIKVKYIDPDSDWEVNTIVVYKDGYDLSTATSFEEFDTFGVTNVEQAFRFGRFIQAQVRLRQENITLTMDFEHLIANRGDLVYLQQDVIKTGGFPVRVKSVTGNRITINDSFVDSGDDYGYTFRDSNGDIYTSTMTIISTDEADVDGDIPSVGDLLVWGVVDKITSEWIIKSISPNDDLSAAINLVEYNPAIYSSESDEFIATYDPNLSGSVDSDTGAPSLVTDLTIGDADWDCDGSNYVYFAEISWIAPDDVYEIFEIYQSINGDSYDLYTVTKDTSAKVVTSESALGLVHKYKVLAVSSNGAKKPLVEALVVSFTPEGKITLPSSVSALYLNVTTETVQINWDLLEDCDIQDYLVRYTPLDLSEARWDKSSPLETVTANTSSVFAQARTGTYLVKARDWRGAESADAALAFTSIPKLTGLNAIDVIEDDPFDGTLDRCSVFDNSVVLRDKIATVPSEYESEGFYYFSRFLDVGNIYTVRLRAEMISGSFTKSDLMYNWPDLVTLDSLARGTGADYQVDLEYRARDSFNVIAEWADLSSIPDMAGGESGDWTDWRRFINTDATGKVFQFRIRLRSFRPDISPQVLSAKIIADMPDRIYRIDNQICPIGGERILFDPAFKGPIKPNIQITQDAAQQDDIYEVKNIDVDGFDIEFFNNSISVERQFDASVLGYGRKTDQTL